MPTRKSACSVLVLLAFGGFASCGESSADDGGDTDGSKCATDADCSDPAPKCSEAGRCVAETSCDTDADCRGDFKFCDAFGQCEPCRTDSDCPSETPACVPAWELGVYCAECRGGDSSTCSPGTWCVTDFPPSGGGFCEPANCATAPDAKQCHACISENAPACLDDGGECEGAHAELDLCYSMELAGSDTCPSRIVPAVRGCTPEACRDEAEAFEACLVGCDALTAPCAS